MKVEEAIEHANLLNKEGRHKEEWYYYPAHYSDNDFFVLRRRKQAEIHVAVYRNKEISGSE